MTIQVPRNEGVAEPPQNVAQGFPRLVFNKVWARYFENVGQKLKSAEAVPDIVSVDATAAGGAYNQAQVQSIVTLANELKADVNLLLAALRK